MRENEPLISIIVPVYNVASYLQACLEAIAGQTYDHIEVLLMDDGSTDGSSDICDAFAKKDSRFRVYHDPNGGISAARNRGLKRMSGEYFMFSDSDDLSHPELVERLYRTMVDYSADMVMCDYRDIPQSADITYIRQFEQEETSVTECDRDRLMYDLIAGTSEWGVGVVIVNNKLFRTALFGMQPFQEGYLYEDEYYMTRIYLQNGRVVRISDPLYFYRQRDNSIMDRFRKEIDLSMNRVRVYSDRADYLIQENAKETYIVHGVTRALNVIKKAYVVTGDAGKKREYVQLYRQKYKEYRAGKRVNGKTKWMNRLFYCFPWAYQLIQGRKHGKKD